jgi:hypothetical protein
LARTPRGVFEFGGNGHWLETATDQGMEAFRRNMKRRQSAFGPDGIIRSMRNRSLFKYLERVPVEKVYQLFRDTL